MSPLMSSPSSRWDWLGLQDMGCAHVPCDWDKDNIKCAAAEGMSAKEWCDLKAELQDSLINRAASNWPGFANLPCADSAGNSCVWALSQLERVIGLLNDKYKHCVCGCMVSCICPESMGCLGGWYDEYRDLTDCDPGSSFEWGDIYATCEGSYFGQRGFGVSSNCGQDCLDTCAALYPVFPE